MKDFNVIAAVALNGIIGHSSTNGIPWRIPTDLQHFKSITTGSTVVMGSNTYRSLGRPLANRRNVIISRDLAPYEQLTGHGGYHSFAEAIQEEDPGFFVIGGERIYSDAFQHYPSNVYVTVVKFDALGDVKFPVDGRTLLQDSFRTDPDGEYYCVSHSEWHRENDTDFQFRRFVRR